MKRFLAIFGIGAVLLGAAFASAAALGVDGGVVQSGSDDDVTCQTTGDVTVSYGVSWDGVQYVVDGVNVNDIDAACAGLNLNVTLVDAGGASISSGNVGSIGTPTQFVNVTDVPAEDVEGVHVAITN